MEEFSEELFEAFSGSSSGTNVATGIHNNVSSGVRNVMSDSFGAYVDQEIETLSVPGCRVQICHPPRQKNMLSGGNSNFLDDPATPAMNFPFKLDPFQQQAINFVDGNHSVVVSAHTSAGPTRVHSAP